jgi:aryl-alcohol dehydrogenase-like predicted oxidoreductase
LPELAIAWILQQPNVAVALTGVRSPAEIEQNVRAAHVRLDEETLAAIEEATAGARGQVDEVPN